VQCKITGKFKIQNQGGQKALSSKIRFFLSDDGAFEEANDIFLKEIAVGPLNTGQTKITNLWGMNLPTGSSASDKFVIAVVDASNTVVESDETNNVITSDMIPSGAEYFPFDQGSAWQFQGTIYEYGVPRASYINTRMITGNKIVNGVNATVFAESNPGNTGVQIEEYLVKDTQGIAYWGSNSETALLSQAVPLQQVYFPLQLKSTFRKSMRGIDLGEDLDGDGVNETIDLITNITVAAHEEVIVPVGAFPNSVRIETKATVRVKYSDYIFPLTVKAIQKEWFAPGLGLVKRASLIESRSPGQRFREETGEELSAFNVGGQGKGTIHFKIAEGLGEDNSGMDIPGRTGMSSDGTNSLLVTHRKNGTLPGTIGMVLSENGLVLKEFRISEPNRNYFSNPRTDVVFDGDNYLVVFVRESQIYGMRVTPEGTMLDSPPGFQISSGSPFGSTNYYPSVAFDGTNYLVVWGKFVGQYDIFGALVTRDGQVLSEFPIFSAPGWQIYPSIAFDGVSYLVIWGHSQHGSWTGEDTSIIGTRVTPGGVVLDPEGISISTAPGTQDEPHLIFDGTNYFAVWQDKRRSPTDFYDPPDIFGTRIRPDGTLLDGASDTGGILINRAPFYKGVPRVAFDGSEYLVVWGFESYGSYPPAGIFGARLSKDGQLLSGSPDEPGIPLSGPTPWGSRFFTPNIVFSGKVNLLTWVSDEAAKTLWGALLFPE
jgi:hypothetical protein